MILMLSLISCEKKNNPLVSVLVNNYNNQKYCVKAVKSVLDQSYNNIEIIFYDDFSDDLSLNKIIELKNDKIKIIRNRTRGKDYSLNQMKAIFEALKKSKGEIVCILDSDDFFKKDKIKKVVNFFTQNEKQDILFDKPINYFDKKKQHKDDKIFKTRCFKWPIFPPTSCISLRSKSIRNIEKKIFINHFQELWFDFRVATFFAIRKKQFNILDDYLTYYRQHESSFDRKYRKFVNFAWWCRRNQAFNFLKYIDNKIYKKQFLSFDYLITKLIIRLVSN